MPIKLACPNCGIAFTFADELRGSTVRCNSCRATFVVTSRPSAIPARGGVPEVYPVDEKYRVRATPREVAAPPRSVRSEPPVAPPEPPPRSNRGPLVAVLVLGALAAVVVLALGLGVAAWLMLRASASSAASGSATAADTAALPDVPMLRYRWTGSPHTYQVRVEVDRSDYWEDHVGNCVFNVAPALRPRPANAEERQGTATGFVVNPNGYLLTCAHVVADASKVEVTVGGAKYPAQVVAANQAADIAIIRIGAQNLPSLSLSNSDAAELGQEVWVLGYPLADLLGKNLKVNRGTLSGVNMRKGRKELQVDATVNFGNSGGPLVSETGLVLGINKSGLSGPDISNINFAAAINDAKRILASKNIAYSSDGWTTKLDGPTLVKRVSAATAFIEVTLGESADDKMYVITCQGHLQKSQRGKPGTNFIPPIPGFTAGSSTRVVVDSAGNIRTSSGGIQMPCLLGDVAQFLIDPLPDDDSPTWDQTNQVTIEETSGSGQAGWAFGPRGIAGMPPIPRPPFGPFGPGGPGMTGRQPGRQTTLRRGDERTTYTREPGARDLVTIRKKYELEVPPGAGRSSSLTLTGDGVITFDHKLGLPRTVEFTATFNHVSGNTSVRVPVTVNYKLQDRAQEAQAAPQPAAPQPPPGG